MRVTENGADSHGDTEPEEVIRAAEGPEEPVKGGVKALADEFEDCDLHEVARDLRVQVRIRIPIRIPIRVRLGLGL